MSVLCHDTIQRIRYVSCFREYKSVLPLVSHLQRDRIINIGFWQLIGKGDVT